MCMSEQSDWNVRVTRVSQMARWLIVLHTIACLHLSLPPDGKGTMGLCESAVIAEYLVERFRRRGPALMPKCHERRALVRLIIRTHDIYISSPNSTQAGRGQRRTSCNGVVESSP